MDSELSTNGVEGVNGFNTDIFGISLEDAMKLEADRSILPDQKIPTVLDLILCCLELKNIEAEILLQADPLSVPVKKMRQTLALGILPPTIDEDIETLSGLLKLYLDELPGPLIPSRLYSHVLEIGMKRFKGDKDRGGVSALRQTFEHTQFPVVNAIVTKRILGILQKATSSWWSNESTNKKLIEHFSKYLLRKESNDGKSISSKELEQVYKTDQLKDSNERRLSLVRKGDRASMKTVLSPDEKRDLLQKTVSSVEVSRRGYPSSPTQTHDNALKSQFELYKEQTNRTISDLKKTIDVLQSQVATLTTHLEELKGQMPSKSKKKK